jgi:hypothetical protein
MAKSLMILFLICLITKTACADVNYYQAKTAERSLEADKSDREARLSRARALRDMSKNLYARQLSSEFLVKRSIRSGRSFQEIRTIKHKVHPSVIEKINFRRGKK